MRGKRIVWLLLLAGSCTSYPSLIQEFDSLAGWDARKQVEPDTLGYKDTAKRFPWLVRQLEWTGMADLMAVLLAFEAETMPVEQPASFARSRISSMAAAALDRLDRMCEMCWRLLMVIEKDETPLNRVFAIHEIAKIAAVFRTKELEPGEDGLVVDPARAAAFRARAKKLVAVLERGWPRAGTERSSELRDAYATALRDLSVLDAGSLEHERSRLRAMLDAVHSEFDQAVHGLAVSYLFRCLQSAVNRGLAAGVRDGDPHVRLAAVTELFRLGPRTLPWILWRLDRRTKELLPEPLAATAPIDEDVDVRRRVLHLCWAVPAAVAGEKFEGGISALQVLVDAALHDPERSLQTLAREALAFHVRRPVDPTGSWIPAWWAETLSGTGTEE